ncbi:MAG: hypothetical protein E3J94_07310 [Desulfobacteraceae bacterium]|nr:MAG: hypothetical protein E3J94_07065 [Desulfobacteraceae bacterium]TES88962.1 MAG: hypothetical protein E3J94_07310 [Desulfobacteraceae bacterium]
MNMVEENLIPTKILTGDDVYERGPVLKNDFRHNDVLAIVADAPCVWDDLEAFWNDFTIPHDILCVNEVATVFPCSFQHFAAGDSHMKDMQKVAKELPKEVIKHAYNPTSKNFDVRWIRNGGGWSGTTTFFAVKVALAMDYLRIVLIGSPLTNTGHWYDKHIANKDDPRHYRLINRHEGHLWKWVELAARPIADFIRSMSGNTADMLGRPTQDWLDDVNYFKHA